MKKRFLILIFLLISIMFISSNLFAKRSGGSSGGSSFSSRGGGSYSGGGYSGGGSSSSRRSSSNFSFSPTELIIGGIIWFIIMVIKDKKVFMRLSNKVDSKITSYKTIVSFKLLIDNSQSKLAYFSTEDLDENNEPFHKVIPDLVKNSDKIIEFEAPKIEQKEMELEELKKRVNEIAETHKNLVESRKYFTQYLIAIVVAYNQELDILEKEEYTLEDFKIMLKKLNKLNNFLLIDNVIYSNVTKYKVKRDFKL